MAGEKFQVGNGLRISRKKNEYLRSAGSSEEVCLAGVPEMKSSGLRSGAMVKPITIYVTQQRFSWYGHVMRRDDTKVAKEVTTMKVGGKRPRGRPRLRWMDRVRSYLRQHQLDPELAQNREAWRKAVMAIDPGQG